MLEDIQSEARPEGGLKSAHRSENGEKRQLDAFAFTAPSRTAALLHR